MKERPSVLLAFIAFSAALTALSLYVRSREVAFVRAHRTEDPRAAAYALDRLRLGSLREVSDFVVGVLILTIGLNLVADAAARAFEPGFLRDLSTVVGVTLLGSVAAAPWDLYGGYVVEKRHGFCNLGLPAFLIDGARKASLNLAITLPLLAAVLWLMGSGIPAWWLCGWAVLAAVVLAMLLLAPTLTLRANNKVTPLDDGPLRRRLTAVAERCGFRLSSISVMDASKQSSHGNALFTGLGRAKRVVLFDTLIAQTNEDTLEAVVAHELGHSALKHIPLGVAEMLALALVAFAFLGTVAQQPWLFEGFRIHAPNNGIGLMLGMTLFGIVGPAASAWRNWVSRRREYQADAFAAAHTSPGAMAEALRQITVENAGTAASDPVYAALNRSHPTLTERVAALLGTGPAAQPSR